MPLPKKGTAARRSLSRCIGLTTPLLAFAFEGAEQDYGWFLSQPYWNPQPSEVVQSSDAPAPRYTIEDALDGLFMRPEEFRRLLAIWHAKKNLVLQGAPGVGKSFAAKRLAYALMEQADPTRVSLVQFHQSYGYEDFMQGYRPTDTGGFELRDGVFHRFCERARADQGRPYVFLIDEINRGNLSKGCCQSNGNSSPGRRSSPKPIRG